MSQSRRDYKIYLSGFGIYSEQAFSILMSRDLPVRKLTALVGRRFCAHARILVRILEARTL
jgi:hypothetical protein